jgi:hypothetical protein
MRFAVSFVFVGMCLMPCLPLQAFSEGGHKLIASIAFRRMSADQRQKIIAIIEHHPRYDQDFTSKMPDSIKQGAIEAQHEWLFQQAAIWPDLARNFGAADRSRFHRGNWHFINKPIFLRQQDEIDLNDSIDVNLNLEPPSNNIDAERMNVIQSIVNSTRILSASDQLKSTKAIHICWLLHSIGDVHQPLHSSALFSKRLFPQGDRGGNSIKTTVNGNLHSVWDRTFGTNIRSEDARNLAIQLLDRSDLRSEIQEAASRLGPPTMWDESYALAISYAYSREVLASLRAIEESTESMDSNPLVLSNDYLKIRRQVCEVAALRAGVRIASYFVAIMSETPEDSIQLAEVRLLNPSRRSDRVSELERRIASLSEAVASLRTGAVQSENAGQVTSSSGTLRTARESHSEPPATQRFPSYDPKFPPPEGTKVFELSQDYPESYDVNEQFPWMEIDFRTNATSYLRCVLDYCLDGNTTIEFRGQDNEVRKWYHAPWMHDDGAEASRRAGREYHHGLTSERRSRPFELHPLQSGEGFPDNRIQNWAISLYSPRGGYTLGKVWGSGDGDPDPYRATFPDNSVSFKLLFSAAPLEQVPFLKDSLKWTANINPLVFQSPFQRVDQELRLLQVDVAIKDPRVSNSTGWVFGTFVYDGSRPGDSPFNKLVPVGLSWGDDVEETRHLSKQGSYINTHLDSTVINHELIEPSVESDWNGHAYVRHHGLGGRLNGPVDNPSSSCISCHGRAAVSSKASGLHMPIINKTGSVPEQIAAFDEFFRLIRPHAQLVRTKEPVAGDSEFISVDYSLQVSIGIRNYFQAKIASQPDARSRPLPRVSRGDE